MIKFLFMPHWWIRNGPTNKLWDSILSHAMNSNPKVELKNDYLMKINGLTVWIENYPYCFGHPCGEGLEEVLPSRKTAYILYKKFVVPAFKKKEKLFLIKFIEEADAP